MKRTILECLNALGYDDKKAKTLIMAGEVRYRGEQVVSSNLKVEDESLIEVKQTKEYVSRGAYKLLAAIDKFNLDFNNQVVLDIGSSTGGFTQVALQHGAKKVYSLDVGTNQLDYSLRVNPQVVVMEQTNLKTISQEMFPEQPTIAVCDVAFISLRNVFKVLSSFNIPLMALIKPQFEANSDQVQMGGFVPKEQHEEIIAKVKAYAVENNFSLVAIAESPLAGGVAKNTEYISLFKKG